MRKIDTPLESYLRQYCKSETDEMLNARGLADELNLGGISLSSIEAQFVQNFVRQTGQPVKKAIEIGTLTGLSALYWIEMLTGGGKLWTLEKSPQHAKLARQALSGKTESGVCEIVEGDAVESLKQLTAYGPFDFIFIDGNKAAYLDYWNWAVANCSMGGIIVVDNVFLGGSVFPAADIEKSKFSPKQVQVASEMTKLAFADSRFVTTIVPTSEGLLLSRRAK